MCPPTLLLLNKDHKTTPILGSRNPGKLVQNLYSRWPDYGNGSFTWGDKLKYAVYNNAGSCRRHISASYFTNCFSTHWRPHPSFLRLARAPLTPKKGGKPRALVSGKEVRIQPRGKVRTKAERTYTVTYLCDPSSSRGWKAGTQVPRV